LRLKSLELNRFRNYQHLEIDLAPLNNILIGRNAQGKSNLLEAVYFLSHLKSNRAPRLRELVLEGEEKASVRGCIMDGETRLNVQVKFGRQGKSVEINGQRMESAARARGLVKCVMFSPEDLYVVKGDAARRREFLDETMEGLGPSPARQILQYRHVLRQRNAVLKSWEEKGRKLAEHLEPWNDALVREGAAIVDARAKMVRGMAGRLAEAYEGIAVDGKAVGFSYSGTFDAEAPPEEIERNMREALEASAPEEKRARTTIVGPHRDDVEIRLGGREARFSVSQGEQRTLAFSLRIAQKDYLEKETGKEPVLLLDDVFSELDAERRRRVLEVAGEGSQALITATELPNGLEADELVGTGGKVLRVEKGSVEIV
jgi:DNA replication and repair protein RecF